MRITEFSQIQPNMNVFAATLLSSCAAIEQYEIKTHIAENTLDSGHVSIVCKADRVSMTTRTDSAIVTFSRLPATDWHEVVHQYFTEDENFFPRDYGVESNYNDHRLYTTFKEAKEYIDSRFGRKITKPNNATRKAFDEGKRAL